MNVLGNYNRGMPVTDIDFSEVSIKGINYSDVGYSLTVNGTEGEMFNRNIISLNTQINFREGTELVLPEGFITPVCRAGTSEEQMHDQYIETVDTMAKAYSCIRKQS